MIVPCRAPGRGPLLGATRAGSLQRVANRPIVCHVLDALLEAGVREVAVLAPRDLAGEVTALVERERPQPLRTVHLPYEPGGGESDAASVAAEFAGEHACVLHRGDGMLGEPLLGMLEPRAPHAGVLALFRAQPARERGLRLVATETTTALDSAVASSAFCGVCSLGPGMLRRLARGESPPAGIDFVAWAGELARDGAICETRPAVRWRHFGGDTQDLLAMNRVALDKLTDEPLDRDLNDSRFEGRVAIDPSATITASVIVGPAIIGPEAVISHSYIGPHTSIGERARIEGVEIERSIVLAGASVLHLSSRLVASVVGCEVRIFRDFSMPRALRLAVGDGDEVALC